MNRHQRTAVAIGTLAVLIMGLFPPYTGRWVRSGDDYTINLGRSPIWAIPSRVEVRNAFGIGAREHQFSVGINTPHLYAQFATVILVTIGAALVLSTKQRPQ